MHAEHADGAERFSGLTVNNFHFFYDLLI